MSANRPAAEFFISTFYQFVIENNLCLDQIFNCDETGLQFRLLRDKTLAAAFEKSAKIEVHLICAQMLLVPSELSFYLLVKQRSHNALNLLI